MKIVELKPIKESTADYEAIETHIKAAFFKLIYLPLLKELGLGRAVKLKNAPKDPLLEALKLGKVTYWQGKFRGRFSAEVSRRLKALGAKWSSEAGAFELLLERLPPHVRDSIRSSEAYYHEKMRGIDKRLAKIFPQDLADAIKVSDLFDSVLYKVEKDFEKSVKNITVVPKLTAEQRQKIADEWQNNMDLWIKDFTETQITELRKTVQDSILSGDRYETLIKGIQRSYDVTERKAKFLARQETGLLMAKHKEVRYMAAGINEYKWGCVKMPHAKAPGKEKPGEVRYYHAILDGTIQRFDQPPITNKNPERRNNPGQDYNCLPGFANVSFHGLVRKAFRRVYTGELTEFITDCGTILNTTANHPILTRRGWIAAKELQIGEDIFSSQFESFFTEEMNRKNMKATAQDVFDALSFCIQIRRDGISESDFHTDVGLDKDVDVISVDRELILNTVAGAREQLANFVLEGAESSGFGLGPVNSFLYVITRRSFDLIGLLRELNFILFTHLAHTNDISLASISSGNVVFNEPFSDNTPSDIVFSSYSLLTHPILIILNSLLIEGYSVVRRSLGLNNSDSHLLELASEKISIHADNLTQLDESQISKFVKPLRIKDKTVRSFAGHVYNFETDVNWFLSSNFIISNCRCFARPIMKF